ncbi:Aste57867_17965 [Aphanomyces stellatus]|uniref:Aste57867_17965 protein n=1 Tax=Aphanomyces stellatus TaxID=120398 RepID=A0A485L8V2_9STRA|nr:hypothetical protein As57867_017903 [Aphanomyces stellatus]VFT94705.1 Aste57867_17965 [Aphanomyces stellatus]
MAESVLAEYTLPLQMIFLEAIGVATVRANPKVPDPHYALQHGHALGCPAFLKVLRHFRICPDLLTRAQGLMLFNSIETKTTKMEITDFMAALAKAALHVFSGAVRAIEWDRQYPHEGQKMRLLLLWMDKNSRLFKANGNKLCRSVAKNPPPQPPSAPSSRWKSLPHVASLDNALHNVFCFYCTSESEAITSMSFLRFLRDAGLCSDTMLRVADIDVIFHHIRVRHGHQKITPLPQTLRFPEFYEALGVVASRLYTTMGDSNRCFLKLMCEYILPAMAHMYHIHLPPTHIHAMWRDRWQELCALREEMTSPRVQRLFDSIDAGASPAKANARPPIDLSPLKVNATVRPSEFAQKSPSVHGTVDMESQILHELKQLSEHLRVKLTKTTAPTTTPISTTSTSPNKTALRLNAALDNLSDQLARLRSAPPPIARHRSTNQTTQQTLHSMTKPTRAKQCQPHTINDKRRHEAPSPACSS